MYKRSLWKGAQVMMPLRGLPVTDTHEDLQCPTLDIADAVHMPSLQSTAATFAMCCTALLSLLGAGLSTLKDMLCCFLTLHCNEQ